MKSVFWTVLSYIGSACVFALLFFWLIKWLGVQGPLQMSAIFGAFIGLSIANMFHKVLEFGEVSPSSDVLRHSGKDENSSAVAAIQFALADDEGMQFLRLWNEGEFDVIRREWPEAPEDVFIGADLLYQTLVEKTGSDHRKNHEA